MLKSYHPFAFFVSAWKYRELVLPLTRRRISARYRGSFLGMSWAILTPLMLLAIYTFIFSIVFQSKWGLESGNQTEFALVLFSGLILYSVFSDCVNEAPSLLVGNKLYIRQLVFPTEILAWTCVLGSLFNLAINSAILTIFYAIVMGPPPATLFLLPLIALPIVLMTLGAVWFLSSIGIFVQDLAQVVGLLTTALLFLSPIFYPASAVPESFQATYTLNPFVPILEMARDVIFSGELPAWQSLGKLFLGSWLFAWLGYIWFMKAKKGFADVV
jgi:lipopolysaccharide transport system permease protein